MRSVLMLLFSVLVSLEGVTSTSTNQSACISGKLHFLSKEKLTIGYYPLAIYEDMGRELFTINPDSNGMFRFNIDRIDHPIRIFVVIDDETNYYSVQGYIEPGDSIFLDIQRKQEGYSTEFSGKGAAKYVVVNNLKKLYSYFQDEWSKTYEHPVSLESYDTSVAKLRSNLIRDAYGRVCEGLVANRHLLSDTMYQLLMADFVYEYYSLWTAQAIALYHETTPDQRRFRDIVRNKYFQFQLFADTSFAEIKSFSESFIGYLVSKERDELYLDRNGTEYSYFELYERLKNKFSGILRDRILVRFVSSPSVYSFVNNYQESDYKICLEDAYNVITTPLLKEAVRSRYVFVKGAPVYPFEFVDMKNHITKLNDFKGSVLLLDVWATNCTGCAVFSKMYRDSLESKLTVNSKFAFLSVNADKTRDRWLKSLNTGIYSQKHHLNVFTNGKMLEDPFLKYYNVQALPFILLIDHEGKVFSKIEPGFRPSELYALIQKSLMLVNK